MKSDVGCLCVLPGWVITHPDLNHAAVRLYAMLAVRLAALGDDDSPTRAALAADTGLSEDTVDRHLRLLVKIGALMISRRQKRNYYTLCYAHPKVTTISHNYPEAVTPAAPTHTSGILRTNLEQSPAYLLRQRVRRSPKWPKGVDIAVGSDLQIQAPGPTEPPETVAELTTTSPTRTAIPLPRFLEVWGRYPIHKDKLRAKQRWLSLNVEEDMDLWVSISAGLTRWLHYWEESQTPTKYIPFLTNWLTREMWEDRPVVAPEDNMSPQSRKLARAAKAFLKGDQ